jgi:hypothetical protein
MKPEWVSNIKALALHPSNNKHSNPDQQFCSTIVIASFDNNEKEGSMDSPQALKTGMQ